MREFARATLFGLVVHYIKRHHPDLQPNQGADYDPRQALVPAAQKRDLLDLVLHHVGAAAVLSIGRGIGDLRYDPIWHAAMRAAEPSIFFATWRRFEGFAHAQNRLRIVHEAERHAVFHRYAIGGGKPTAAENLFVCGVVIALLEEIGCAGLYCDMPLVDGAIHRLFGDGHLTVPADPVSLTTTTWTIGWQAVTSRDAAASEPNLVPAIPLPWPSASPRNTAITAAIALLAQDVTRQWTVDQLAAAVGLSTRSLQRRLYEADHSFSSLVRLVRLHMACYLLQHTATPITAVGFCAGFSDSAHLSRDFRTSLGLTPTAYRAAF